MWGLAGGGAAGLVSLMTSIAANGFAWWSKSERGPRLFVFGCSLLLGALVAAAASSEMSGPWPAFVIGVGAPSTIKGLLSGIEVDPPPEPSAERLRRKKPLTAAEPHGVKEDVDENVH